MDTPLPGRFQRSKATKSVLSAVSAVTEESVLWNDDAGLEAVLKKLEKNSSDSVELLQRITLQLTADEVSHTDFIRTGGVQTLSALLASDNPNIQLKALSVLEVLADNPRNAVPLLQQGVLNLLVHILASPRYNGRRKALTADIIKCLGGGVEILPQEDSLLDGPMSQLSLLDAPVAPPSPPRPRSLPVWCYSASPELPWDSEVVINLVDILSQGGLGELEAPLAHALTRITLVRSMGGPLVVEPPVMEALISLLYGMHPGLRQILHVLVALCILHPLNEALLLRLPGVSALAFVASCDTKGGAVGELTAWVLAFLASQSKEAAKRVAASDAVEVLVQMLYSEEQGTREAATRAVSCLAASDSRKLAPVRRKLVRSNAVPGLLSVLQGAEQQLEEQRATIIDILRAFWKMRGVKECRDEMKGAGVLEALHNLSRCSDGDVAFLAVQVIHGLSAHRRRLMPLMRVVRCQVPVSVQLSQQHSLGAPGSSQLPPHMLPDPAAASPAAATATHMPRQTSMGQGSRSSSGSFRVGLITRIRVKVRKLFLRIKVRPKLRIQDTSRPAAASSAVQDAQLPADAGMPNGGVPVLDSPEPRVLSPTRYNATLRSASPSMRALAHSWEAAPGPRSASASTLQGGMLATPPRTNSTPAELAPGLGELVTPPRPHSSLGLDRGHVGSPSPDGGSAWSGEDEEDEEEAVMVMGGGLKQVGRRKRMFRGTAGRYARI